MNKELANISSMPIANGKSLMGKNNIHVDNQKGGTVNINYIYGKEINNTAEQMVAVQSFNKDYYQLIVTCDDGIFQNNVVSVSANRALLPNKVPPEIYEKCSALTDNGKEILKRIPAIICMENTEKNGITDLHQYALYCYIKLIKKQGKEIKIAFHPIAPILQHKICEKKSAIYFDLNMDCAITDLNTSEWTVHKVNLFEAFAVAGIDNIPVPN